MARWLCRRAEDRGTDPWRMIDEIMKASDDCRSERKYSCFIIGCKCWMNAAAVFTGIGWNCFLKKTHKRSSKESSRNVPLYCSQEHFSCLLLELVKINSEGNTDCLTSTWKETRVLQVFKWRTRESRKSNPKWIEFPCLRRRPKYSSHFVTKYLCLEHSFEFN